MADPKSSNWFTDLLSGKWSLGGKSSAKNPAYVEAVLKNCTKTDTGAYVCAPQGDAASAASAPALAMGAAQGSRQRRPSALAQLQASSTAPEIVTLGGASTKPDKQEPITNQTHVSAQEITKPINDNLRRDYKRAEETLGTAARAVVLSSKAQEAVTLDNQLNAARQNFVALRDKVVQSGLNLPLSSNEAAEAIIREHTALANALKAQAAANPQMPVRAFKAPPVEVKAELAPAVSGEPVKQTDTLLPIAQQNTDLVKAVRQYVGSDLRTAELVTAIAYAKVNPHAVGPTIDDLKQGTLLRAPTVQEATDTADALRPTVLRDGRVTYSEVKNLAVAPLVVPHANAHGKQVAAAGK